MKICLAAAQMFPTDGQTDKHDVTSSRSLLYERAYKNIGCNEKIRIAFKPEYHLYSVLVFGYYLVENKVLFHYKALKVNAAYEFILRT
jgi:hypothetical protein